MNPFFSIIIPTYNVASTIECALLSILNQSFTDFEILIMDGLSTDYTLEVLKGYNDKRIILYSEKDRGVYDAMNKGIEKASGSWIYFLGADDELYNDKTLENIYFEINKSSSNVIYANVLIDGNTTWANHGQKYDGEFNLHKLLKTNICHQAIFYNLEFLKSNGVYYNLKYLVCADWDFNLKLWSLTEFEYVNSIIAIFKAGGISTLNSSKDNFYNEIIEKFETYFLITTFRELSKYFEKKKLLKYFKVKKG